MPRPQTAIAHAVNRAVIPLYAAGDFERFGVVEGGGGFAVLVVDGERDFGHVAGGAIAAACKDDVVHTGGT